MHFGAIASFLVMWLVVACHAYGQSDSHPQAITQETLIPLGLFIGAIGATALFVWKIAKAHNTTQARLDCLEKKIEQLMGSKEK